MHSAAEIQFPLYSPLRGNGNATAEAEVPARGRLPRVTQVLALAIQFQEMIRTGEARDFADLARLGGLTRERISQITRLAWLAPDIQIEILYLSPQPAARFPLTERAVRRVAQKISWTEQRQDWTNLKQIHGLL